MSTSFYDSFMNVIVALISGTIGLFATKGFVAGIRRAPGEHATFPEWALSACIGLLVAVMMYSLLHSI